MARITPFSVGQRWYCDNTGRGRGSFTFVILGPGDKPNEKKCRLEYDDTRNISHNHESFYSHKHLKKYAKLVEGKYTYEWDEGEEMFLVFTPDGSKAVSSWCDEEAAKEDADRRNGIAEYRKVK